MDGWIPSHDYRAAIGQPVTNSEACHDVHPGGLLFDPL